DVWESRPWRRRCELHRRTTGRWPQTDRELGIGDVVTAESGDTCALYIGCRNAALKADLSPAAPADPIRCRLEEMMGLSGAIAGNLRNGPRRRHERRRGQVEFRHCQLGGGFITRPKTVHRTPPLTCVQAGDGRPW